MDYLELLKDINIISYFVAFVKWSLLFLVISILLLIVGNRYNLFRREKRVINIVAKSYYLFIPIYFLVFALKFAPLRNTQNQLNSLVDSNRATISEFAYDFITTIDSDSLLLEKSSIKDIVDNYLKTSVYDSLQHDLQNGSIGKRIFYKTIRMVEFNFLCNLIESRFEQETSGLIGIGRNTSEVLYKTSLYKLFNEGEIVEVLKLEMNNFFKGIYKTMFLFFILGLLIPIMEIIVAKIYKY